MARDDGADAKMAAAVAVTAALFSPRMRGMLRRGAVHGLAGVLTAGDALAAFARGVSRGVQESAGSTATAPAESAAERQAERQAEVLLNASAATTPGEASDE